MGTSRAPGVSAIHRKDVVSSGPRGPAVFLVATVADQLTVQYPEHVRALAAMGAELHVFASAFPDYLARDPEVTCHEIPIRRLLDPAGALRSTLRIASAVRRHRPAFVLYGSPSAALVASVGSRLGVPHRVLVVHGLREETLTGARRRLAVGAGRLSARLSTLVVFVSPSVCERSGYLPSHRSRSAVSPGGFVGTVLPDRPAPRPETPPTVGFIGRLARDKGVEHLVRAVATLRTTVPDMRLLLVGGIDATDPPDATTLAAIAGDPRTTHTGQVSDSRPYLREMTLLALPSYREGLPTVVLEAMAEGVPVVGSDATGMRDVVTEATGWPCRTGSDAELVEALRSALDAPEERRRRADDALTMVRERYTVDVVMPWWTDLYAHLIGPGSATSARQPPGTTAAWIPGSGSRR